MVDVRVVVINPQNLRQIAFNKRVKIDTGFDAGFHIRESEMADLQTIGVRTTVGNVTLAGNITKTAYYCFGYLQRIGDYMLPAPGIEITLVFQGDRTEGLIGLESISNWIVTFDGPSQQFKISV